MPSTPGRWTGEQRWVLAVMCAASAIIVMDGSIVNVALPTLARALRGVTNSGLQWIVDAYVLTFAALLMPAGSLADRFGRRRLFLAGLAVFGGAAVGASTAGSAGGLVLWRGVMGVGAAMIFPTTLAVLTEAFPAPGPRRAAIAAWAGASGLGVALGPIAAGLVLARLAWGWIFLIHVPVVLAVGAGAVAVVRESRDLGRGRFDAAGAALAAVGVLGVVLGVIEAPERGWTSAFTLASVGAGLGVLAVFAWWESRCEVPMLEMAWVRDRAFAGACLALTVAFFGLFGFVFLVTQFFQFIQGYDALQAGVRTLPFAGFIAVGALGAAGLRGGAWRGRAMGAGLFLMGAGFWWASWTGAGTGYGVMVGAMALLGVGLGLVNAIGTGLIMGALPPERAGAGSSVNDTLRELGGTLGVACVGSAFNSVYRARVSGAMEGTPLPTGAREAVRGSVAGAAEVIRRAGEVAGEPMAAALRGVVHASFMDGFGAGCRVAAYAALAGGLVVMVITAMSAGRRGASILWTDGRGASAGLGAATAREQGTQS